MVSGFRLREAYRVLQKSCLKCMMTAVLNGLRIEVDIALKGSEQGSLVVGLEKVAGKICLTEHVSHFEPG